MDDEFDTGEGYEEAGEEPAELDPLDPLNENFGANLGERLEQFEADLRAQVEAALPPLYPAQQEDAGPQLPPLPGADAVTLAAARQRAGEIVAGLDEGLRDVDLDATWQLADEIYPYVAHMVGDGGMEAATLAVEVAAGQVAEVERGYAEIGRFLDREEILLGPFDRDAVFDRAEALLPALQREHPDSWEAARESVRQAARELSEAKPPSSLMLATYYSARADSIRRRQAPPTAGAPEVEGARQTQALALSRDEIANRYGAAAARIRERSRR